MYAAGLSCLVFSNYTNKWIFSIVSVLFYIPTAMSQLEKSNLGVKVQIFLQTFVLDLLIGLPRNPIKNIVTSTLVIVAIQ